VIEAKTKEPPQAALVSQWSAMNSLLCSRVWLLEQIESPLNLNPVQLCIPIEYLAAFDSRPLYRVAATSATNSTLTLSKSKLASQFLKFRNQKISDR
jgi:hypothetical protein